MVIFLCFFAILRKDVKFEKSWNANGERICVEIDLNMGRMKVMRVEELEYKGNVAEMYLYGSAYYFIQAKIQIEEMESLDPEKNKAQDKFINTIGINTIQSTCKVFAVGLKKLEKIFPR